MIPITVVRCGPEEEALVLQVLRSGLLAQGPMVERFEACCRDMTGADHAVAVNNGTTALVVALEAMHLRPGDEVVTSPFTFVATLNSILESGATVRFADIDERSFNLDPRRLDDATSSRTRVVMPVHLYGHPADMGRIAPAAAALGATVIEDAAQAHGARIGDRPIGTYGMATFSFYATKNLQCGEGGVVTTNDATFADRIRLLRNQGMRSRYDYEVPGHNYRLTDLSAAVAVPQFARLRSIIESRERNATFYNELFRDLEGIVTPEVAPGTSHAWHQYTLRITGSARRTRDSVLAGLSERGVGAGIYYPRAVYDYECFRGNPQVRVDGGCPVADRVGREVLSLPVHQYLTRADRDVVASAVRDLLSSSA